MQVISGRIDRPTVHFEAPPAGRVPSQMKAFLCWFNETAPGGKHSIAHAPIRSGLAHIYFESIHPFEDGNGRLGRAISEKALSQGLGFPAVLSLSRMIESHRSDYYEALQRAQRSCEITDWLVWFSDMVVRAQVDAKERISFVLKKHKFLERMESELNKRQLKVIRRMLESGPEGFEGGMNNRKYVALTKASRITASRDLQHLVRLGAVRSCGGGRSTRYELEL